ncbi:MAG: hypothetical protein ACH36H_09615 [Candidatus Nanopelagicales bacterium]
MSKHDKKDDGKAKDKKVVKLDDWQPARTPSPVPQVKATWRADEAAHDYPAAANYLELIADPKTVDKLVQDLKNAKIEHFRANDLLRAARLELLPFDDLRVRADLVKIMTGVPLSPVLIVRGDMLNGYPLTIADGYHRVCASYQLFEGTYVPAKVVDLPVKEKLSGT